MIYRWHIQNTDDSLFIRKMKINSFLRDELILSDHHLRTLFKVLYGYNFHLEEYLIMRHHVQQHSSLCFVFGLIIYNSQQKRVYSL